MNPSPNAVGQQINHLTITRLPETIKTFHDMAVAGWGDLYGERSVVFNLTAAEAKRNVLLKGGEKLVLIYKDKGR